MKCKRQKKKKNVFRLSLGKCFILTALCKVTSNVKGTYKWQE